MKNLDKDFMDLPFDPDNKYSIPYFWGTVGILYNPEKTKRFRFHELGYIMEQTT